VANRSVREMRRYFNAEFRKRREKPREDLISRLLQEAGGAMNDAEIFSMCMLILIAGHETTTNLIGNGVLALLRNPEQLALLRREPERIDAAVEEILRYDSSVQAIVRVASEDIELRDKVIRKGQTMMLSVAAANRDPEVFADPDRFDITRSSDQGHASFGKGSHFCLGAALARLETKIAILFLIQKFPQVKIEAQSLNWIPALSHRGLKTLWVDLGRRI
jgi:cytochrome P450